MLDGAYVVYIILFVTLGHGGSLKGFLHESVDSAKVTLVLLSDIQYSSK